MELNKLGFDHSAKDDAKYEAVTLEDVKRVARKCWRKTSS
jgi:hypothetical protein